MAFVASSKSTGTWLRAADEKEKRRVLKLEEGQVPGGKDWRLPGGSFKG